MEQYTANSNSSTEQIVVQAGQIQQQVWRVERVSWCAQCCYTSCCALRVSQDQPDVS